MAIPGRDERGPCYALCGCCTFFGCLLTVILVPLTYSKLEYFQHGIVQQKSTSKVDRTAVYGSGSHPIGPDYQFKIFETNALNFDDSVAVWTKATGDNAGATLTMDVSFQYRIDDRMIGALYDQIGTDYEPMIRSYAIDAIRNTAPLFLTACSPLMVSREDPAQMSILNQAMAERFKIRTWHVPLPMSERRADFPACAACAARFYLHNARP